MIITKVIPRGQLSKFHSLVGQTNGRFLGNLESVRNGTYVRVEFSKISDYTEFNEMWSRMTTPIVEKNSIRWYSRFWNRIKLILN